MAITAIVSLPATAQQLTANEVLDGLDVSAKDRQKLASGEVVAYDGEEWEATERELATDALVVVHKSLAEIAAELDGVPSIIPTKYLKHYQDIESLEDFDGVAYGPDDHKEVDKLLGTKAGKEFNLSDDELRMVAAARERSADMGETGRIELASKLMRDILIGRYEAYRNAGLDGVPGYRRSRGKTVSIGDELRMTTETLDPIEEEFLPYYRALLDYPDNAECCEHVFRWLKVRLRKRPTFALSHTIIEQNEHHLVVTERHYYVSSTLNSTQLTLLWLPYDSGSYMGLAISASTDILDSMMGRMLRPLGRNKARDLVADTLTEIRDDLQDTSAPADP